MSRTPLVSVVMPAYNAQSTIGAAITGVLSQTYPAVELVVVDDGSTDATPRICAAYGSRLRYVRQENAGTAAARNRALAQASGEFIALCDADDVLLPPYLAAAMAVWQASASERTFVACDAHLLTDGGIAHGRRALNSSVPAPARQRLAILQLNFVPIFTLMPRAMPAELGGWRAGHIEDWDLWMRAIHAGWTAVGQPVPHALYRWSSHSKSTEADVVFAAEDALLARFAQEHDAGLTAVERDFLRRRTASGSPRRLVHEADSALRDGDARRAARLSRQAAQLSLTRDRLLLKSATLRVPPLARAWRRRLLRIDETMARDVDVQR